MPRNEIIVGLDNSHPAKAPLRWAAQQALLAGSLLRAIHILDWPYRLSSASPAWTSHR
jgi:nucleotide-binding universal stress UspA family protein